MSVRPTGFVLGREIGRGAEKTVCMVEGNSRLVGMEVDVRTQESTVLKRIYDAQSAGVTQCGLPRVIDIGPEKNGKVVVIMERYPEDASKTVITDVVKRVQVFFGVLRGCTHLHELGFMHGDPKPQNCLVSEEGDGVLIDFGMSKRFGDSTAVVGCGSGYNLPPEFFETMEGIEPSTLCDSWGLGVIGFMVMTQDQSPRTLPWAHNMRMDRNGLGMFDVAMNYQRLTQPEIDQWVAGNLGGFLPEPVVISVRGLLSLDPTRRMQPECALRLLTTERLPRYDIPCEGMPGAAVVVLLQQYDEIIDDLAGPVVLSDSYVEARRVPTALEEIVEDLVGPVSEEAHDISTDVVSDELGEDASGIHIRYSPVMQMGSPVLHRYLRVEDGTSSEGE